MFEEDKVDRDTCAGIGFIILLILALAILAALGYGVIKAYQAIAVRPAEAAEITLTASWYSIESLKKEGTYKYSKGVMANGKEFRDKDYTCAIWGYKFGTILKVTNLKTGASVQVVVTDRIGKRFAKTRIDLSKAAFQKISRLEQGIIKVSVEALK